jgi:hypothetical protein
MTALPTNLDEHDTALAIAGILEAQCTLNDSVSKALQAVALTADRYDDELALVGEALSAIRSRLTDMNHRLAALEADNTDHSRKVTG